MVRWIAARLVSFRFSALQRAEIAEMLEDREYLDRFVDVSVLFNEPKLLKSIQHFGSFSVFGECFSALQRAEIAEILG